MAGVVTVMAVVTVMVVAVMAMAMAVTDTTRAPAMGMDMLGTGMATFTAILATDTGMGTMVVGITVIGTLARADGGMVAGTLMALAHAGISPPLAGSGSATENFRKVGRISRPTFFAE
jgi:hypothetical protein